MEKETDNNADASSTTTSSIVSEKEPKKRKRINGSSSALRKRFARFRRRRRRNAANEKTSNGTDSEEDVDAGADADRPEDTISITQSSTTAIEEGPESIIPVLDDTPTDPQIATATLPEEPPPPPPNSPPAYPAGNDEDDHTRRMTTTSADVRMPDDRGGRPEKAPLRGLEAEYDDRDIAAYTSLAPPSQPPPIRRPSRTRVRFTDEPARGEPIVDDVTPPPDNEEVPSFEALPPLHVGEASSSIVSSRAAAGATRRAHVATDDKGLLERLRGLADEPALPGGSSHPPEGIPGTGDAPAAPLAPSFDELDDWHAERQLELVGADSTTHTSSSSRETTTAFPALPPPILTSTVAGQMDAPDYALGTVWNGMGVLPPSASTSTSARVPSAPPLDISALLPSAPPPLEDADQVASAPAVPSAPPAWDDEDDEEAEDVHSAITTEHSTRDQPESSSRGAQQQAAVASTDSDLDGAESVIGTPPGDDIPRWSDTFQTRAQERAGLPRYEP